MEVVGVFVQNLQESESMHFWLVMLRQGCSADNNDMVIGGFCKCAEGCGGIFD